jgi:hypothetical protein
MKKVLAVLLIASIISAGCAHTTANPVLLAQPGDDNKSCDAITNEMQQMVQARATAEQDRNNQIAGNVALGVAGIFLIVPWFFMDTGNAATVEERAAQARYQRLNQMAIDKKCPATPLQPVASGTPDPKSAPSAPVAADGAIAKPDAVLIRTDAPAQSLSPIQKLEALDVMLKKGLITQDEYNSKKQEILKTM